MDIQPVVASAAEAQKSTMVESIVSRSETTVTSSSPGPGQTVESPTAAVRKPTKPPPGYKLIKRRKEDGTYITIMRKMSPEELERASIASPAPTSPALNPAVKYKIVTVRDSDGGLIRVKRPIKPEDQPSSTPASPTQDESKPGSPLAQGSLASRPTSPDSLQSGTSDKPRNIDGVVAGTTSTEAPSTPMGEQPLDMAAALAEQKEIFRQKRMRRMKGSLIRGLGTILGSSVQHTDLDFGDDHHGSHQDAGDIEDGDIIDSDQSWSEDDDDDDDLDGHHHETEEHDNSHHESPTTVHFNGGAAASGAINALAARAAAPPPKPTATTQTREVGNDETDKSKSTYKVTAKDLEEMERKAADKDAERQLQHHWTNVTFYLMASLSIILPLLFLVLAIFVLQMNDRHTNSRWSVMPDLIKIGVSAWPIVFAAVVAQVFKAYATWKVERGIKLIQLEQLVGSSSFASAIKQPMLLRHLDVLSLLLLLTWCLSPFGSQALQRSYHLGTAVHDDSVNVRYVKQYGVNQVFGSDWNETTSNTVHAEGNLMTAILFLSAMEPDSSWKVSSNRLAVYMDQYKHPIMFKPYTTFANGSTTNDADTQYGAISRMGVPMVLPDSLLSEDDTSDTDSTYEAFEFFMQSSYFSFTCGDWELLSYAEVEDVNPSTPLHWSTSHTLGMLFTDSQNASTINHVQFASANLDISDNINTNYTAWEYSSIECDFEQKFINTSITCQRLPSSQNLYSSGLVESCWANNQTFLPESWAASQPNVTTALEDFSDDWTSMASPKNPDKQGVYATPTEIFIQDYNADYTETEINMTAYIAPSNFSQNLAYLFNTWVSVGYCPECNAVLDTTDFTDSDASVQDLYATTSAARSFHSAEIYQIVRPWAWAFLVSTVLLLLAGVAAIVVESVTVAPDTLGYVSTVARNSRYLHVKPTSGAMTGAERARKLADTNVMLQDVKAGANVGKIALGLKSEKAVRLQADRLYR